MAEALSMTLMDQLIHPMNLAAAWDTVRASALAHNDVPSADLLRFAANAPELLERLASTIRNDDYRPGPLIEVEIPKGLEKTRYLRVPLIKDRVLERAIYNVVEPLIDPHLSPLNFGFRKGMGVEDAISAVVTFRDEGLMFAAFGDVQDCFDSIDRRQLLQLLDQRLSDQSMSRLIARLMFRKTTCRSSQKIHPGIAQGAPLSPLLSNLFLDSFDQVMLRRGFSPIRYSDDFVIPCRSRQEARLALEESSVALEALRMTLTSTKAGVRSFKEGVRFLGFEITEGFPSSSQTTEATGGRCLYVCKQGASVRLRQGQIQVVLAEEEPALSVPARDVSRIVLFGSVGLSAGIREQSLRGRREVVFLSRRGRLLGRLDGMTDVSLNLRRRQYGLKTDDPVRINLASALISGKLWNMRALLLRYRRRNSSRELIRAADQIRGVGMRLRSATHIASLSGMEGTASRAYFGALRTLVPPDLGFTNRSRRPPRDPVNAALSFGYTLLLGEAVGAAAAAGLDPHVGILHTDHRARPSLALDLIEEFRSIVVDTTVLEIFRRGRLRLPDFRKDQGGFFMTDPARKRFIASFEDRMLTSFAHTPSGKRVTYRRGIYLEASQLANVLNGRIPAYRPISWR